MYYASLSSSLFSLLFFFFNDPATTEIYTLSLHDALPICHVDDGLRRAELLDDLPRQADAQPRADADRSEEHTSELQSRFDLVCRLLLEKKKKNEITAHKFVHYSKFRSTPTAHRISTHATS